MGRTQVINETLDPFWGVGALAKDKPDKSLFKLPGAVTQDPELHIDVYDWDLMDGDEDFLGKVRIPFEALHDLRRLTSQKALDCHEPMGPEYFRKIRTVMKLLTREEAGLPPIAGTMVTVKVEAASGLAQADRFGKSDPFFIVRWNGTEVGRTAVIDNTLNPTYENETFDVFVPDGNGGRPPKGELSVECYDSDMPFSGFGLGAMLNATGDFLGCFKANGNALSGATRDDGVSFLEMDGEPSVFDLQPMTEGVIFGLEESEGLHTEVEVTISAARGLAKADMFGQSDPFVKISHANKQLGKTPVIKKTLDPDWTEGNVFSFHIPEDEEGAMIMPDDDEVVMCEVFDSDMGGLLGDFLGRVQITGAMLRNLPERGKNRERDWELEEKEGLSLKQKKLVKGLLRVCVKLEHNCRGRARKIKDEADKTSDDLVQGEVTLSFTTKRADQAEAEGAKAQLMLDGQKKLEELVSHTGINVTIQGANELAKADTFGSCDATAVVKWKGIEVGQTPTCKMSLNPRWNKKNIFQIKVDDDQAHEWEEEMEKDRDTQKQLEEEHKERKERKSRGSRASRASRSTANFFRKSADKVGRVARKSAERSFRLTNQGKKSRGGDSSEELDPVAQAMKDARREAERGTKGDAEEEMDPLELAMKEALLEAKEEVKGTETPDFGSPAGEAKSVGFGGDVDGGGGGGG